MITYSEVDIKVSPSGDISVAPNGDLDMADASGTLKQDIVFRVKTDFGDFEPHPDIGADLVEIIGEPNTRETCMIGEGKIVNCLVRDGRVLNSDLVVKGVPISRDSLVYYIFVKNGTTTLNVTPDMEFDLSRGIISY